MVKLRHLALILILFILFSLIGCSGIGESIQIHEKDNFYALYVPNSKLSVIIPKNGFIQYESREVNGPDHPRYFFFGNDSRQIAISGWFESEKRYSVNYSGIKSYGEELINSMEREGLSSPQNVSYIKIGNWDAMVYEVQIPEYTNSHIRAHWIQAGTWIDLHISFTTTLPSSVARSELTALLKTIQIVEL